MPIRLLHLSLSLSQSFPFKNHLPYVKHWRASLAFVCKHSANHKERVKIALTVACSDLSPLWRTIAKMFPHSRHLQN